MMTLYKEHKVFKILILYTALSLKGQGVSAIEGQSSLSPSNAPDAQFHIQQLDPNFSVEGMKGSAVIIHPSSELEISKKGLLSTAVRDKLFEDAHLNDDIKSWDQLDRDLLFIRAKKSDRTNKLITQYPTLDPRKLALLTDLIQKRLNSSINKKS